MNSRFIDILLLLCYNLHDKRINTGQSFTLSDISPDGMLDVEGIAVRIRSNSHYRIFRFESSRNALRPVTRKRLLGK